MQNNDTNRRKKFYDQMSEAYDLGTFDEFNAKMDNAESREKLYKAIEGDGKYDIGSFDHFEEAMKPKEVKQPQTNVATTQAQPTDTATTVQQAVVAPAAMPEKDFGFTADSPSPLQPEKQEPYKMPLMFKSDEVEELSKSPNLNKIWARGQAFAQETMAEPIPYGWIKNNNDFAGEAETARLLNRKEYDTKNFDQFYNEHVAPTFSQEKALSERKADEAVREAQGSYMPGAGTGFAEGFRMAVAAEKNLDPEQVANNTIKRVQNDSSFGDYILGRMGINGAAQTDNDSPQLSEREQEWMNRLFAKETEEVANQITNRIYSQYQQENAPKSTLEYIAGKAFHENLASSLYKAMVRRAAGSSAIREQLRAMAYDEFGKDQGWITRVAGGAAPFAVDMLSGGFALPNFVGQAAIKGGTKLAARELTKRMSSRAAARGLEGAALKEATSGAAGVAERYIATQAPIMNLALQTMGSAANFATYETQAEAVRQIAEGKFKPIDLVKEAVHGAMLGTAMGATGGIIGNLAKNASTLGKIGAGAAGIGAETGIFALDAGLQKAQADGVDIQDVDWADTAGEAFGTVIGMKGIGAVMHPRNFLNRYRKSKDYNLQLNQGDLNELKQAGYNLDDVFKGLGTFGDVTPMQGNTISKAKEITIGNYGKQHEVEDAWVDADNYESIMRNPEISTSAKRKIAYIATGKILTPEPMFGVTMNVDENGKATVTTLNAKGDIIETKEYNNEQEAQDAYAELQQAARTNTIGGLERIADKSGHPEVVDVAKGRTKDETGIDIDNLEQMAELKDEDVNKVMDAYIKNLQDAYMERFNENLERLGEAAKSASLGTESSGIETQSGTSGTQGSTSETEGETPMQRSDRREASYQRGASVVDDESSLQSIGHDQRVAEARLMQQMPDGSNTEAIRNNIIQAVEANDLDAAEQLFDKAKPFLNNTQRDALEQYLDAASTQSGIDDAIVQQAAAYEERQRQQLQSIADEQGNITPLQLRDGSNVYLVKGDLSNHYSSMFVTDGAGNITQHLVSEIVQADQPRSVDEVLAENVNNFAEGLQHMYSQYANYGMLRNGQQVNMILSGQPVTAVMSGYDPFGNAVFTMEDGSQIALRPEEAQQAVMEADNVSIQQQLAQEAESVKLAEQQERFSKGIKGYNEGHPDLTAAETDSKAAAEYLTMQANGDERVRKQQISDIENTKEQLTIRREEANRELNSINQWINGNEGIADAQEMEDAMRKRNELDATIKDIDQRLMKYGEIRRNLMTKEELAAMEQQRRKEIFNARTGYQPQVPQRETRTNQDGITEEDGVPNFGLTSVGNANNYLLRNYPDSYDAEQFITNERLKLRNKQRDEVQPEMNKRNDMLNAYADGTIDLSPDEVKQLVHEVADLEAQQDVLAQQAVRLREIADGIQALYERNGRTEELTPAELRAKELDKAGSKEDKLRIARTLYKDYPEALDRINDQDPRDLDEFIAANLGLGSMNWEGINQGERHLLGVQEAVFGKRGATRGIGKGYTTNAFNHYLAPTGEGKDFNTIVHGIYEALPDVGDAKQWTTEDISNALINMLLTAQKPSDISHRIIDNRIAEAEEIVQHEEEYEREMEEMAKLEEMQAWADAYHLTPEERDEFEEFMKMAPTEPEIDIINNIIANEQDSRSNELDNQPINNGVGTEIEGGRGEILGQGEEQIGSNQGEQRPVAGGEAGAADEAVTGDNVSGGTQERYEQAVDNMARIEEEWRDKLADYVAEHYPTQAVVSAENKSEKGIAEREAMKNDPVYQDMIRQAKEAVDAADKEIMKILNEQEEHIKNIKKAAEAHQKKYRTLAPLEVLSINSDDDLRKIAGDEYKEFRKYLKESKLPACYDTDTKKIYIFAENIDEADVELGIFHESFHRGLEQYYGDGLREVAEAFWETESPTNPEKSREGKKATAEAYKDHPQDIKEEYLTLLMGLYMSKGTVDKILARLSPEHQEIVNNILINIGYDREQEKARRTGELHEKAEGRQDSRNQESSSDRGGVEDNSFPARLAKAIAETNTNPTEAQKEAGNYRKPELKFGGYTFRIENPKGSIRSGVDRDGREWSQEMHDTYGYIEEKVGKDGDKMDFFINDDADLDAWDGRVYVVDQKNEDGTFDEHKVMYGYPNLRSAREAYKRNYEDGWYDKHVMKITGVRKAEFDKWLADSDHKIKPFSEYYRTKMLKDVVDDDFDQLISDVKERLQQIPVMDSQYTDEQVSKMDINTLSQLIKKSQEDGSTSRYLLANTKLDPASEKADTLRRNIAQSEADIKKLSAALDNLKKEFKLRAENAEAGGAIIDHLQNMGIDVTADTTANRKVYKKAEKDNSQEGKLHHMRTPDGTVYGFTYKGKIYLDPRKMDANRPLHEYGHLWADAFRRLNPEGWKDVVSVMKQDADTWQFVKSINPDLQSDSDIAEEMIAKGSGEKGEERVRAEFERMAQRDPSYKGKWNNIWKNISKAIQDFWKQIGDFLGIKYKTPAQVYDQVLRDFANGVNPRKKVEEYLKQRDAEYAEAVKSGNTSRATQIFNEALKENVGNGMTPFVAVDKYRKMQSLAHKIKDGDAEGIRKAAQLMSELIPENAVLIPTPSHKGKATTMLQLAEAIAERTGSEVADILESNPRESQYTAKKQGGKAIAAKDMGIKVNGQLPEGKVPVIIDNVVDTGNTAEACVQALGTGIVASLADSTEFGKRVATLRSAAPIIANKQGEIVPLSERFDLSRRETARPVADITTLMDDVEQRNETARNEQQLQAAILSDKEAQEYDKRSSKVRQRATDAVLTALDDAKVPVRKVSRQEADQMMRLFTSMNIQAITEMARSMQPNSHRRYAVIDVRDPFSVPKYFEKRSYANEFKIWANKSGRLYELIDLGRNDANQEASLRGAADIMPEIQTWHGSGAVFTKFDHSHMSEGAGSQAFGWGTYLSDSKRIGEDYASMVNKGWAYQGKYLNDIKAIYDGKNHKSGVVRDILSGMNYGYTLNEEKEKVIRFVESSIRDYEDEINDLSEADKEDLKDLREILDFVKAIKPQDFKKSPENLYKVEIPDDNGNNYLEYKKPVGEKLAKEIRDFLYNHVMDSADKGVYKNMDKDVIRQDIDRVIEPESNMPWLQRALDARGVTLEEFSKWLSQKGYIGIKYPAGTIYGGGDGATNYVIFNEDDAKIVEHIQFMVETPESAPDMRNSVMQGQPMFQKSRGGRVYGWTDGTGIFLTPDGLNPNTPIHEYTHIWDAYVQKHDPELWKEMVSVFKQTDMWQQIRENPNYRAIWDDDNRMASEVHSRLSGQSGEQKFTEAAKDETKNSRGIINKVKNVLKKFWESIAKLFGYGKKATDRLEEFVNMPLRDLLTKKFNPIEGGATTAIPMSGETIEKTLMGVHNISEEKLKKAIKLGGLANPSLAVIDTKNGIHTDYGEISLIPRSSLIDAKTGRNAGTYAGDAWTPTYPNVERTLTKKGDKHVSAIAKEAAGDNEDMMYHITRTIEDYVEGNGDRMHFLFLKQKGMDPKVEMQRTTHSQEEFDEIQKIFGEGTSTLPSSGRTKEQDEALLDLMTRGYKESVTKQAQLIKDESKREAAINVMMKNKLESLVDKDGNLYFAPADTFVYDNWRDNQRRKNAQPDWYRTDNEASYRVAKEGLSEEYSKWRDDLLSDEDIDERLFAGWTEDGNKKYVKNTVANASRLMNKEADTNAYGNGGLSASKAGLVKKLKTLADIRKYRHLIKVGDDIKEQLKQKEDEWFNIIHQVSDMQKIDSNPFINVDIAEARLQEAMTQRDPIRYLNSEYGYHIAKDSELASELMNFIESASEIPVKYFETKFKRPVGIEEFAVAVVPTTTSPEVVKALEDAGLEVRTYEKGDTGDEKDENRKAAVLNAVHGRNDILFHTDMAGESSVKSWRQGELFSDDDFLPEPKGKKSNRIKDMSDEELLKAIADKDGAERRTFIDIFDQRHIQEHEDAYNGYLDILNFSESSLEDAYQMYDNVWKEWKDGGYATSDRTRLLAQIDALEDFIQNKEEEQRELELERQEEEEAAQLQKEQEQFEKQKEEVRQTGYDLTQIRFRALEPGETCHVERRYTENKMFSFTGTDHIESIDDVAYIFRQLENKSVENTFVVLEKDGVPTVIHLAIGDFASAQAPMMNVFAAYNELNPERVWFIHNHPSGHIEASKVDKELMLSFRRVFGDKLQDGIIINTTSGKYGVFNELAQIGNRERPTSAKNETPIKVYSFDQQVFDKDWNPETAFDKVSPASIAEFISSHRLGEHKKMSLLVMDTAGHITGNIFLPWTNLKDAAISANATQIATYVTQMGGGRCVIYGNYDVENESNENLAAARLKNMLQNRRVTLMDMIHMGANDTHYNSMHEKGVMEPESTSLFVGEPVTDYNEIARLEAGDSGNTELAKAISGKLTLAEVNEAMNSKSVKAWLNRNNPKSAPYGMFGGGDDILRALAKARLGITNKYGVTGQVFYNAGEEIESIIDYAREHGLDKDIADKHDFKKGETWQQLVDSDKPVFTDKEVEAILKAVPLNGAEEALRGAIQAFADEKNIREEIEYLKNYDNGNAYTKALALRYIAMKRLREQYEGDERFFRPVAQLQSPDPTRNNMDISNQPDFELREGETKKTDYAFKKGIKDDILRIIATTPVSGSKLALEDGKNKMYRRNNPVIRAINDRYNEQLKSLNANTIFNLGNPAAVLVASGIENKPLRLYGNKLLAKLEKHGYAPEDVRDLPIAVHNPIAIFSGSHPGSFAILTELDIKGNKVLVTLSAGKGGSDVDFNVVSSVYDKNNNSIFNWINQQKGLYYDKAKALDYLRHSAPIAETTESKALDSAAKIVNDFENPSISEENLRNIYAKEVRVAEETADLLGGEKIVFEAEANEDGALGWYDPKDGSIHVVLPAHANAEDVQRTVCHEKLGHEGLVALLGSQKEVDKFGHFVLRSANADLKKRIIAKADEIDPEWKDPLRYSHAAQEVIADIAANGPRTADEFSLWRKIKHYLIRFLNKLGLRIRGLLNDHDLRYYVLKRVSPASVTTRAWLSTCSAYVSGSAGR